MTDPTEIPAKPKRAQPIREGLPNAYDLATRLEALEERLAAFETACPPEFRKLATDTIRGVLKLDSSAEFEVLKTYKHGHVRVNPGQTIRADHYPKLMDHVLNGLMLGRVIQRENILEKYRVEAEARRDAAEAAREEMRALGALAAMKSAVAEDP